MLEFGEMLNPIERFGDLVVKFPVTRYKFPVLRNIFPVDLSRELLDKSLQHSGFLLRNMSREPQKCKIPGIMAQTPQAKQR